MTPSTLYAGTVNGLLKSVNGGDSWTSIFIQPVGGGGTVGQITAIAIDPVTPSTIYVGSNRGLYKSVNGGMNWAFAGNGLTSPFISPVRFSRIAISRSEPMTIYAMIEDSQVFKTTNGGGAWVQLTSPSLGFAFCKILCLSSSRRTIRTLSIWASRLFGVYKTIDGGSIWNPINNGFNATEVRAITIDRIRQTPSMPELRVERRFRCQTQPGGTSLVYSSYLGGGALDSGSSIAVDSIGAAYVTGVTTSADFPVLNAFQSTYQRRVRRFCGQDRLRRLRGIVGDISGRIESRRGERNRHQTRHAIFL